MRDHRALLRRQDKHLLDFADTLTETEWAAASLCHGWTNKDVLAHLALGLHVPLPRIAIDMIRHRSFDEANDALSRHHGNEHTPAELLAEFDHLRQSPRGLGRALPDPLMLGDHTVHHLDIAVALGRRVELDPEVATAVLDVETTIPNPFVPAKRRSKGLRLATTDADWSHGPAHAPQIRGPATALISVLAGRGAALEQLSGDGLALLRRRLNP